MNQADALQKRKSCSDSMRRQLLSLPWLRSGRSTARWTVSPSPSCSACHRMTMHRLSESCTTPPDISTVLQEASEESSLDTLVRQCYFLYYLRASSWVLRFYNFSPCCIYGFLSLQAYGRFARGQLRACWRLSAELPHFSVSSPWHPMSRDSTPRWRHWSASSVATGRRRSKWTGPKVIK